MTTLYLYVNEDCYKNLVKSIEKINSYELGIVYEVSEPDEQQYRDIKITTTSVYDMYRLGIEMGKIINK